MLKAFKAMLEFFFSFSFREAYPEVEVQDIQFAYDINKLNGFDDLR